MSRTADLSVAGLVDPPGPFHPAARLVDSGEPFPQLIEAHRGVPVGIATDVVAQKALLAVELVVRAAAAVDVPVEVPRSMVHALPVGHGVMAQDDLLPVDLEHADRRLHGEGARDRRLGPVLVVVSRDEVDAPAGDLLAQPVGVLGGHLE